MNWPSLGLGTGPSRVQELFETQNIIKIQITLISRWNINIEIKNKVISFKNHLIIDNAKIWRKNGTLGYCYIELFDFPPTRSLSPPHHQCWRWLLSRQCPLVHYDSLQNTQATLNQSFHLPPKPSKIYVTIKIQIYALTKIGTGPGTRPGTEHLILTVCNINEYDKVLRYFFYSYFYKLRYERET